MGRVGAGLSLRCVSWRTLWTAVQLNRRQQPKAAAAAPGCELNLHTRRHQHTHMPTSTRAMAWLRLSTTFSAVGGKREQANGNKKLWEESQREKTAICHPPSHTGLASSPQWPLHAHLSLRACRKSCEQWRV